MLSPRYSTSKRTRVAARARAVVVNEVEQAIGSLNGSLNSIWLYRCVFTPHVKSTQHCGGRMSVAWNYDSYVNIRLPTLNGAFWSIFLFLSLFPFFFF